MPFIPKTDERTGSRGELSSLQHTSATWPWTNVWNLSRPQFLPLQIGQGLLSGLNKLMHRTSLDDMGHKASTYMLATILSIGVSSYSSKPVHNSFPVLHSIVLNFTTAKELQWLPLEPKQEFWASGDANVSLFSDEVGPLKNKVKKQLYHHGISAV